MFILPDIFFNTTGKQYRLLAYHCDVIPIVPDVHISQIIAGRRHLTGVRVIHSLN